jgi:cytochrome c oxidase subunit 2
MELRNLLASLAALGALAAAAPAQGADPARATELWELCVQCHGADGAGDAAAGAPAIAGLPEWFVATQLRNFKAGLRGMHPGDTTGLRMYPMSLWLKDDADIQTVSAHVAALPPVRPPPSLEGGDAARGAALYATCATCHGPEGQGVQAMNGPPLAQASDWYLLASLEKFKAGIRGGDPRNANAVLMRSFSNMLADEQAMKDVIAYVRSLGAQAASAE